MATNIYPWGECTWWVWGRVDEVQDIQLPGWGDAENWYKRAGDAGYSRGGIGDAQPGDILCWGHRDNPDTVGHVQYVESVTSTTVTVSESYHGVSNPPLYVSISKSNPTYGRGDGFPFQGVILLGGGVSPEPPPEPPTPGEEGHYEPVYEEIEVTHTTEGTYLTDIYECSENSRAGNSGTQDQPRVPKWWGTATSRHNFRWDPLTCYTQERTLTYDSLGNSVWSAWETVSQEDNYVEEARIGTDQWLSGWEKDWGEYEP